MQDVFALKTVALKSWKTATVSWKKTSYMEEWMAEADLPKEASTF